MRPQSHLLEGFLHLFERRLRWKPKHFVVVCIVTISTRVVAFLLSFLFEVLTGEAFTTADLEDHGVERVLRAQLRNHHGADFRWETGLDEFLLVARGHLIEVELERFLREDFGRPFFSLLGILSLFDDLLLVEQLPEALNRRPEVDTGISVESSGCSRSGAIDLRKFLDDVRVPFEAIGMK